MDPDTEAERRLSHTCDGKDCGQTKALYAISLPNGGLLSACGHHRREWQERLDEIGALILETY